MIRARISAVATHLPAIAMTTDEAEDRLVASSPDWRVPRGFVERLTGVRRRYVAVENASDLAAAAARTALAERGLGIDEIDLLVFASASRDMVEPATAHITADLLGASCPALDVTDACNSFLQGLGIAEAMVRIGRHRRVLVVTGETPSRAVRWRLHSWEQFVESLPGYTLSDGGAAAVVEACAEGSDDVRSPGIEHVAFAARSSAWRVGTLPGGGSAHPHDPDAAYFRFDSRHLKLAFEAIGPGLFLDALRTLGITWDDLDLVCVHQVAIGHLESVAQACGIPHDKLEVTVAEFGNLASASLPFQLRRAMDAGRVGPGSRIALLGLAGGISLGVAVARL